MVIHQDIGKMLTPYRKLHKTKASSVQKYSGYVFLFWVCLFSPLREKSGTTYIAKEIMNGSSNF